jgi:hypothetical protein
VQGVIPISLQQLHTTRLDLSYNKITGEYLHAHFGRDGNYSRVVLSVNRLSGKVPSAVERVTKLDILNGNVFSCSGLPSNDEHRKTYSCGSSESNQSLFLLAVILGACMVSLAVLAYSVCYSLSCEESVLYSLGMWAQEQWRLTHFVHDNASMLVPFPHIAPFDSSLMLLARAELCVVGIGLVCCIPLYIIKIRDDGEADAEYAVLTHMYGWLLSAAYVTGTAPAVILLGTWSVAVTLLVVLCTRHFDKCDDTAVGSDGKTEIRLFNCWNLNTMWTAFVLLLNTAVVVSVNALYVYSTILRLSPRTHLWIQIGVALFKYIYNYVFVPAVFLVRRSEDKRHSGVWLKLCILMFNSIVIPAIVTMVTDPSCYQVRALTGYWQYSHRI